MSELRIAQLTLRNFKGVELFTLCPFGNDVAVFGDNATGKTTLADAFTWLLFGVDSAGRTDFEIKTLDAGGEPGHGVEHSVYSELILSGGVPLQLRRTYKEKWVKRRGSAERTLQGHTTDYEVDGVPTKALEYEKAVAELGDPKLFQLLTDPMYFSERMHWQDRRQVLLEIADELTDEDVIGNAPGLEELPDILDGKSIDDRRKILKAELSGVNKKIETLPTRIDEVTRGLPEISETKEALSLRAADLRVAKVGLEARRDGLTSGGEMAKAKLAVTEAESARLDVETTLRKEAEEAIGDDRKTLRALKATADAAAEEREAAVGAVDECAARILALGNLLQLKRAGWDTLNDDTFEEPEPEDEACPTCGQSLPQSMIEATVAHAREQWNVAKAESLAANAAEGKELAGLLAEWEGKAPAYDDRLVAAAKWHETAAAAVKGFDGKTEAEPNLDDERYLSALADRNTANARVAELEAGSALELAQIANDASAKDQEIMVAEGDLLRLQQRATGEERVEELKAEESTLGALYEEIERKLFLTEEFVRRQVAMLEERINSKFKMARFNMFHTLLNGALEETAETTYGGVPWHNLNHGARIQVGLDIIWTLQEHHGFAPPVWIDQGESVTHLPDLNCQSVRLVVNSVDKELRVVVGKNAAEQVA